MMEKDLHDLIGKLSEQSEAINNLAEQVAALANSTMLLVDLMAQPDDDGSESDIPAPL